MQSLVRAILAPPPPATLAWPLRAACLLFVGALLLGSPALADPPPGSVGQIPPIERWSPNGRLLVSAPGDRHELTAMRDGAGGAYLAWRDSRNLPQGEIWITHIDANGLPINEWTAEGMRVRASGPGTPRVWLSSGDSGGIYVVVQDADSPWQIFVHHYRADATVAPGWPADGLAITLPGAYESVMVPDVGLGMLCIAWRSQPVGGYEQIWMRRWSHAGTQLTPAAGIMIHGGSSEFGYDPQFEQLQAIGDGLGRVNFVMYYRPTISEPWRTTHLATYRGIVLEYEELFGQSAPAPRAFGGHGNGVVSFQGRSNPPINLNGRLLAPGPATNIGQIQIPLSLVVGGVTDGQGGAIYFYQNSDRLTAYRLNPQVTAPPPWWTSGLTVFLGTNLPLAFASADLRGGAFVGSINQELDGEVSLRAQHLLDAGTLDEQWGANGSSIRRAAGAITDATALLDGLGGYLVFWLDSRDGTPQIYGQKFGPYVSIVSVGPAEVAIAISLARQPARAGDAVRCMLPLDGTATLESFDVQGRRLWREDLGGAAGPRLLVLPAATVRGVSWLRLSQGGKSASTRLIYVP